MIPKIIALIKTHQNTIFLAVLMVLISFISFNLGKIQANTKGEIKFSQNANIYQATKQQVTGDQEKNIVKLTPKPLDLRVVASKNSDKYHYTWCPGAKQIKEENKVWFSSDKEAESRGYTLAGNCSK